MKKHTYTKLSLLKICLLAPCLFSFQSDTQLSQFIIPVAAYSVSSSDIDLDGDQDLLVGHNRGLQSTNPSFTVLLNNGGVFSIADTSKSYGGYQENIFACKIDNDQYPDLVTFYSDLSTGKMKRYIRIWFNQNGSFTSFQDYDLNRSDTFDWITHGDVNGDGLIDILVLSSLGRFWGVLYNTGNGTLSLPAYHYVTGYYPLNVASGDLNGDGWDDVIISGQSTEVYYSFPAGFQRKVLETNNPKELDCVVDFDGDGDNDLLTASEIYSLVMYRNLSDTALHALPMVNTLMPSTNFSVLDFNNDDLPDVAFLTMFPDTSGTGVSDTIGGINIFFNLGNFQLSTPQFINLANYDESWRNFCSSDFDSNGFNDFAVIRALTDQTSTLELLYNDGNGNFTGTPVGIDNTENINKMNTVRCYPNPFVTSLAFEFFLEKAANIELSIYDSHGGLIRSLYSRNMSEGHQKMNIIDADKAITLKSGIYFACLKLNGKMFQSQKIIKF